MALENVTWRIVPEEVQQPGLEQQLAEQKQQNASSGWSWHVPRQHWVLQPTQLQL
jgi:hypothetical protein